ncbi:MAG: hypothetical protein LAN84_04585 [Acidobacteriia bacterium]|nr:hypothetical protein [Terriglobia bacterium]
MRKEHSTSSSANDSRCRHFTREGRRCRLRILNPHSGLCFRHAGLQDQHSDAADSDLTAAFSGLLNDFHSAAQINDFLSKLVVLLAQNRISSRRAAVLAYINQLLLRTLPAIEQERYPQSPENASGPVIVVDLPRPVRTPALDPDPQSGQPS